MELVDIRDLFHHQEDYVGKKITVGGWVRSNRNSKNFGFIGAGRTVGGLMFRVCRG